jgi:hypothetical protein
MDDDEISALAKGMVPFVRECVAQTLAKQMIVAPEIAEQVASAVRLLHESPEISERSEPPPAPPKVTAIKRDEAGNFVPVYDEH